MWTVAGQDEAVATLARAVAEGRVSHAYLFAGPRHVGKTTTALQFAQALNCTSDSPPCGECRACRLITEGKHPDVEVVAPGGLCDESDHGDHKGSREIRICQVRRVERIVSRTPYEGRYRVVIVDPADALNTEAANAFLKTLEEPPASVVVILVVEREEALPQTVRSRCRRVAFGGIPRATIAEALVSRWDASAEQAEELSRMAQGRLGWAVGALSNESVLAERERALVDAERAVEASFSQRLTMAGELATRYSRDKDALFEQLATWQGWWRDLLLVRAGKADLAVNTDRLDSLRGKASQCTIEDCLIALQLLAGADGELEENANPLLALEALMLELPRLKAAVA